MEKPIRSLEEIRAEIYATHNKSKEKMRREMRIAVVVFIVLALVFTVACTIIIRSCVTEYKDWKNHIMEASNETD